jgi:DNA-binding MarR family transcriptional regulator
MHPNVQYKKLKEGLRGEMAEDTLLDHIDDLMKEELLWKAFDSVDRKYPKYFLTDKGVKELKNFHNDKAFDEQIDKMTAAEAKETLKDVLHGSIL